MLPLPERTPEELNARLARRLESFASDLQVIEGMTRRGAVLPAGYRQNQLQAMRRYCEVIFHALTVGEPAECKWHMEVYGD